MHSIQKFCSIFLISIGFASCVSTQSATDDGLETVATDESPVDENSPTDVANDALSASELPEPDLPAAEDSATSNDVVQDTAEVSTPPESEVLPNEDSHATVNEESPVSTEGTIEAEAVPQETNEMPIGVVADEVAPSEAPAEQTVATLVFNSEASGNESAPSAQELGEYVVRPGDSLSKIAARLYGNAASANQLAQTNNLQNPNLIFPGDVIRFDKSISNLSKNSVGEGANPKSETVQIQRGDTLSKIAYKLFGDAGSWKYLWRLNQGTVTDPDKVSVGTTLTFVYPEGTNKSH